MTPLEIPTSKHSRSIINIIAATHMTKSSAYFYVAGKYFTCDSRLKIIGGEFQVQNSVGNRKE
jgi:hypothetical protein